MRLKSFWLSVAALLLAGCGDQGGDKPDSSPPDVVDGDADGFAADVDCDDEDAGVGAPITLYADTDGDGYGDDASSTTACPGEAGYVADANDCDDAASGTYPGAAELCDGVDSDCDGLDDGADAPTWYLDYDGDGYGGELYTVTSCEMPAGAWFESAEDCDDADATISPVGTEVCDGQDNDCDAEVDEAGALGTSMFYADTDADGFGDPNTATDACFAPDGYVDNDDDCDDADAGLPAVAYEDDDHDGFGALGATGVLICGVWPAGYSATADDCDDTNASANPGASEVCDDADVDEDCNGLADDDDSGAVGQSTWYVDYDGDGYGDGSSTTISACDAPSGYSLDGTDCDDNDVVAAGGGVETCDGLDNDCDGVADWGNNVPSDYATIADALQAVDDGATVCVAPGTYTELIDLGGLDVTIEGYGGSASTIIDGSGAGPVLLVAAGETARVSGVTLTGGENFAGAAVWVEGASLELEDVLVDGNSCTATDDYCYGVIYSDQATLTFTDVDVTNNYVSTQLSTSTDYNYGTLLFIDSTVDWHGGSISTNVMEGGPYSSSYSYGGVLYAQDSDLLLDGVDVTDNEVASTLSSYDYVYGMVYLYRSTLDFQDGAFTGNVNFSDYYAYHFLSSYYGSSLTLTNADFSDNLMLGSGTSSCYAYYFLYNYYSDFAAVDSTVSDNTQRASCGSTAYAYYGIYNYYGGVTLQGTDWTGNLQEAASTGGSAYAYYRVYSSGGSVVMDQTRYSDNIQSAETTAGSAYAYYGFYNSSSLVTFTNTIFSGNVMEASGSSGDYAYYGFFYDYNSDIVFENVDVTANSVTADTAYTGFFYESSSGTLSIRNTTFASNSVNASSGYANIYYNSYAPSSSSASTIDFTYSDVWDTGGFTNDFAWSDGTVVTYPGTAGNVSVDPTYRSTTSTETADWNFRLGSTSSLIDAGDPSLLDADGTVSDIGAYGGPGGDW